MKDLHRFLGLMMLFASFGAMCGTASASFHLWTVNEAFSNADGTIQFIELTTTSDFQQLLSRHTFTSNTSTFLYPSDLGDTSTANRFFLMATEGFTSLPGAVVPDYVIADNFFSVDGDTLTLVRADAGTLTFAAGELPVDGVLSLNSDGSTGTNSPTNFAGDIGSVDLSSSGEGEGATVEGEVMMEGEGMSGVDGEGAVDGDGETPSGGEGEESTEGEGQAALEGGGEGEGAGVDGESDGAGEGEGMGDGDGETGMNCAGAPLGPMSAGVPWGDLLLVFIVCFIVANRRRIHTNSTRSL